MSKQDRKNERDRLFVWVSDAIAEAMHGENLSKADVARRLGMSRANVTRLLNGRRNLTLKSMADLAWAANSRIKVEIGPLAQESSRKVYSVTDFVGLPADDDGIELQAALVTAQDARQDRTVARANHMALGG
jgi:transcriptional regulator with XRE-family HTH domain